MRKILIEFAKEVYELNKIRQQEKASVDVQSAYTFGIMNTLSFSRILNVFSKKQEQKNEGEPKKRPPVPHK